MSCVSLNCLKDIYLNFCIVFINAFALKKKISTQTKWSVACQTKPNIWAMASLDPVPLARAIPERDVRARRGHAAPGPRVLQLRVCPLRHVYRD